MTSEIVTRHGGREEIGESWLGGGGDRRLTRAGMWERGDQQELAAGREEIGKSWLVGEK